jgi:hypothetical protein
MTYPNHSAGAITIPSRALLRHRRPQPNGNWKRLGDEVDRVVQRIPSPGKRTW